MKVIFMNKKLCIEIIENLKQTYPDAKCSLDFSTPFELLIAVMLSAQCTDDRANKTTPSIFAKYNTPEDFAKMDLSLLENSIHFLISSSETRSLLFIIKVEQNSIC